MINGLDLFSGIGGLAIALQEWVKPIAYCEIESYCQGILLSRMATGDIGTAPIWDDVTSFPVESFAGQVDIIYGGFPCQDISIAGLGKGLGGERSRLFFEIMRLAKEIKPKFIFLENVPAITSRGGLQVIREIASLGYDCRWCIISAASVGALHKRERWFLLAHSTSKSADGHASREKETYSLSGVSRNDVSNSKRQQNRGVQFGKISTDIASNDFTNRKQWQKIVSEMGKCSHGISNHVDRLRSLGNAVVPEQAKEAFKILMGITCN